MNARLTMMLAGAAAIALLALGCGGDDETGSPAGGDAGAGTVESGTASEPGAGSDAGGAEESEDDSEEPTVTTSSLGKAQFVKRAESACGRLKDQLFNEVEAFIVRHRDRDVPEGALFLKLVRNVWVPKIEAQISTIRRLGAPEGDEEEIEAILAAQQEGLDEARELQKAESYEDVEDHFVDATKLVQDYGIPTCANSPTTSS